jgi:hypothetical protein
MHINFITLCLIPIVSFIHSRDNYLTVRNNFLKFYLKLENYRLKYFFHRISNCVNKIHYYTIDKFYDISYKYYTLTENEKDLLEALTIFI